MEKNKKSIVTKFLFWVNISILLYYIILLDFHVRYESEKYIYKIEYKGLLWVGLDYWSIWKYHSNDEPMKWLTWDRTYIAK